MAYPEYLKSQAQSMRENGYSIKEIAKKLKIAVSTSSVWLSNVKLSDEVQEILRQKKILGQYKSSVVIREKTRQSRQKSDEEALEKIKRIKKDSSLDALCCSLLYWAEGSKNCSIVGFTNSDPIMISTYLKLLRSAFPITESKFRCLVHIHEYHDDLDERTYWSKITSIPLNQFSKSYLKPHTGNRKKQGYHGTISVRYYDAKIGRQIKSYYNMFVQHLGA